MLTDDVPDEPDVPDDVPDEPDEAGEAGEAGGLGLGRTGRRVVVGIVVAAVLLVAGGVVVALHWADVRAWADAPAVLDAHRTALAVPMPAGIDDDPTLGACDMLDTVRCGVTAEPPRDAVEAFAGALRDGGLDVDDVVCDDADMPMRVLGGAAACGAAARLPGATLWVLATDRTPVGGVPFGRTAVWAGWDTASMSGPLLERLAAELPVVVGRPITAEEARALLPERLAATVGTGCRPDDATCLAWDAPLDATGLGDDPAATLVRELVDAGLFPATAGGTGPDATVVFASGRVLPGDGAPVGLIAVVRNDDAGGLTATINSF